METKGVAILGSTGSIGQTALDVIERFPDRFRVVAITANRRLQLLKEQVDRHRPALAVLADHGSATVGDGIAVGWDAVLEAAAHPDADIVVNALVGATGLEPTLAALKAGKRVALANKESLVVGGSLVLSALEEGGGELIPVDSEHSAVFQCLGGTNIEGVERVVLTASGGPFREWNPAELEGVTPAEALRHPTWTMGAKITIDSATMVNKALEVIEAHFLFGLPYDRVAVVIHPQSIVHSLVEFQDGSVLAQLGQPTMSVPILYALTYPDRLPFDPPRLDLVEVGSLSFEALERGRYPAFDLGREAAELGGTGPAVFNAANEVAVAAFLGGLLPYSSIPDVIKVVLREHEIGTVDSLDTVKRADTWARQRAGACLQDLASKTTR